MSIFAGVFINEYYNDDGELGKQVVTVSLLDNGVCVISREIVFFAAGSNPNYLGKEKLKEVIEAHKQDLLNEYTFLFLDGE